MPELRSVRSVLRPILWLAPLLAAGCAPTLDSADFSGFGRGAAAVGEQADLSFAQSNRLARDASIESVIRSDAPGLTETRFQVAVDPETVLAWQTALAKLERYGAAMASLTDATRGPAVGDAIVGLGRELRDGQVGAKIAPGVAAGFAELGSLLIAHQADKAARRIVAAADPAIQRTLGGMAAAIGENDGEGLRGTAVVNWAALLTGSQLAYADPAISHDVDRRRAIVNTYLAGIDRRDAQLRTLAALRASLLALAAAHANAAAGQPRSVEALIAQIDTQLGETQRLYDAFAKPAA